VIDDEACVICAQGGSDHMRFGNAQCGKERGTVVGHVFDPVGGRRRSVPMKRAMMSGNPSNWWTTHCRGCRTDDEEAALAEPVDKASGHS